MTTTVDWDRFQKAISLRDTGKVDEALVEFAGLLKQASTPEDITALTLNIVTCLNLLGRREEAHERLLQARAIAPDNLRPYVSYLQASYLFENKKYQEALDEVELTFRDYHEMLNTQEERDLYEDLQASRGMLLAALDRPDEAKPVLEEALSFSKDRSRIAHFLGVSYYRLSDFQRAKELLVEAFELGVPPELVAVSHYYLGLSYFQLGFAPWAKQELERAAATVGNDRELKRLSQVWLNRVRTSS